MLSVKISLDYYKNPIDLLKSFAFSLSLLKITAFRI